MIAPACRVAFFALVALAAALVGYYRPLVTQPGAGLVVANDGWFYAYQLGRAADLDGRWWELARLRDVGSPYPSAAAKHPGIYEGVDLLLVSCVTGRFLPLAVNYHVLLILVLTFNGAVAGWLVRRVTGSTYWAALAAVLITLNLPTANHLAGTPHLVKHGWVLLAAWAFHRYLEAPTAGAGFRLGLACALTLQGSFYFGYFVAVAFAAWWLGCLVAGRLRRAHLSAAVVAGATCVGLAAALTWPVWLVSRQSPLAGDAYFRHAREEVWNGGAELWEYVLSPRWAYTDPFLKLHKDLGEGLSYPGVIILVSLALLAVLGLRGRLGGIESRPVLRHFLGLSGLFVLLSLSGGPSGVLFDVASCFRNYGRAGTLAVGMWCVAVPIALAGLTRTWPAGRRRWVLGAGLLTLAVWDGTGYPVPPCAARSRYEARPGWSTWLERQPSDVRLAILPSRNWPPMDELTAWSWQSLYEHLHHRHATLNGAERGLVDADLVPFGATVARPNPDGLAFLASLGYDHFAFDVFQLVEDSWVDRLGWLERVATVGCWAVYRATAAAPRFPTARLEDVLLAQPKGEAPRRVPPNAVVTGGLRLPGPVALPEPGSVLLQWVGADGRPVGAPYRALFQHLLTPSWPAYRAFTPGQAGAYRLEFRSDDGRCLASVPYEVDASVVPWRADDVPVPLTVAAVRAGAGAAGPVRVAIENRTDFYLEAYRPQRKQSGPARYQPPTSPPGPGSLVLRVRAGGEVIEMPLPADLPPHGRVEVEVSAGVLAQFDPDSRLEVRAAVRGPEDRRPSNRDGRLTRPADPPTRDRVVTAGADVGIVLRP